MNQNSYDAMREALERLLDRCSALDISATHDGLENCAAIAQARAALAQAEKGGE